MKLKLKNRIRELRKANNWTQLQLAELLKVSRQTINSIENGRYDPSLTLTFDIAEVFKIPIEGIFSRS